MEKPKVMIRQKVKSFRRRDKALLKEFSPDLLGLHNLIYAKTLKAWIEHHQGPGR